jgi:hypothetical protein
MAEIKAQLVGQGWHQFGAVTDVSPEMVARQEKT